jgi:hypothetical protein
MAKGKAENRWDHTASLMAMIHNANVAEEKDAVGPDYFHPHHQNEGRAKADGEVPLDTENLHAILKPMVKSGQFGPE